ncbi:MAG: glutaredoxin domain-containing protein [Myxococcota bacterium]
MRELLLFILIITFLFSGINCKKAEQKRGEEEINPPEIVVSKENKNLLFSYIDKDGNFKDTQNMDEIPEESRRQVIVFDLSIPPSKRLSHKIIYIADLTKPDSEGRYKYTIASRYQFDSAVREGIKPTFSQDSAKMDGKSIIIYTTSWCGVCAQLRKYLRAHGINYIEKDIEKDDSAREEMLSKLRSKGLRGSGVPVIDLYGEIIVGFNKELLDSKIK